MVDTGFASFSATVDETNRLALTNHLTVGSGRTSGPSTAKSVYGPWNGPEASPRD